LVNVTPRSLYPDLLYRRLGGPQGRSGRLRENLAPPPSGIRSPNRPARSESLYRLSYPGPLNHEALMLMPLACFPSSPERLLCNALCLSFCDPKACLCAVFSRQASIQIVQRINSLLATAIPSLTFRHTTQVSHRLVSQHPNIVKRNYYSSALETCSNVASARGL